MEFYNQKCAGWKTAVRFNVCPYRLHRNKEWSPIHDFKNIRARFNTLYGLLILEPTEFWIVPCQSLGLRSWSRKSDIGSVVMFIDSDDVFCRILVAVFSKSIVIRADVTTVDRIPVSNKCGSDTALPCTTILYGRDTFCKISAMNRRSSSICAVRIASMGSSNWSDRVFILFINQLHRLLFWCFDCEYIRRIHLANTNLHRRFQ